MPYGMLNPVLLEGVRTLYQLRDISCHDEKERPAPGSGTWGLGGGENRDSSHDKECIDMISWALEMGYTHIDTAEMYGGGDKDEPGGKAVESTDRSGILLYQRCGAPG